MGDQKRFLFCKYKKMADTKLIPLENHVIVEAKTEEKTTTKS